MKKEADVIGVGIRLVLASGPGAILVRLETFCSLVMAPNFQPAERPKPAISVALAHRGKLLRVLLRPRPSQRLDGLQQPRLLRVEAAGVAIQLLRDVSVTLGLRGDGIAHFRRLLRSVVAEKSRAEAHSGLDEQVPDGQDRKNLWPQAK